MTHILDRVSASSSGRFRPTSVAEFFALQLARKLGDVADLHKYLILTQQHPEALLLQAFQRARKKSVGPATLAEGFEVDLNNLIRHQQGHE